MKRSLRSILLLAASLLLLFGAITTTTVTVPHLREDLLEINVRPTLVSALLVFLHFGSFAIFGFGALVIVLAVRAWRGATGDRILIGIIAAVFLLFGIAAFVWTGSHHSLGYVLIGLLLAGAIFIRD